MGGEDAKHAEPTAQHEHHYHIPGRRLRQFLRPSGQKIHVASNPEEVEGLRRALTLSENDSFDVVINGSPEHVSALREAHAHYESECDELKAKHGADFIEFTRIIRQMDDLANELHVVSDHAVQLDANFSKFGYSAHLRTRDSPNGSSANSLSDGKGGMPGDEIHHDWDGDRTRGMRMPFWKTPVIRQYFHKGLLWRSSDQQEVASYELFVDLFYVGIIAISGDRAAELQNGRALHAFAITYIMAYRFWQDISMLIQWFDSDDVSRRINMLFSLTLLLGMTTNINESLDKTYTPLVSFYLASRIFRTLHFLWMGHIIPMVRNWMIAIAITVIIPCAIWIGSIHVEEPNRYILVWIALFLDLNAFLAPLCFVRWGAKIPGKIGAYITERNFFDFYPATNIEHRIDRTGAFVTLVFGYSVVALLYQSNVEFGLNAFFGKAVLGLIQAFCFNWIYFEMDHFNLHNHAIRRHILSSIVWISIHLPFTMGFVLSGATLSRIVLAHDVEHANPDDLTELYHERSEEVLSAALRWFYCAGLAVALGCMGIISLCHIHKERPDERLHKRYRLAYRFVASLAILLLPIAEGRLDSLELVALTTCIVISVLAVELVGATCYGETFWRQRRTKCKYSASCKVSKKDFEAGLKNGEVLNVEEIAKKEKGVKDDLHF